MKSKEPMVIKGVCRMKKEPYPRHELDIKKGDEFVFEYIGRTCASQRRIYRLTDKQGKTQYLSFNYFKIYMEYRKENQ